MTINNVNDFFLIEYGFQFKYRQGLDNKEFRKHMNGKIAVYGHTKSGDFELRDNQELYNEIKKIFNEIDKISPWRTDEKGEKFLYTFEYLIILQILAKKYNIALEATGESKTISIIEKWAENQAHFYACGVLSLVSLLK